VRELRGEQRLVAQSATAGGRLRTERRGSRRRDSEPPASSPKSFKTRPSARPTRRPCSCDGSEAAARVGQLVKRALARTRLAPGPDHQVVLTTLARCSKRAATSGLVPARSEPWSETTGSTRTKSRLGNHRRALLTRATIRAAPSPASKTCAVALDITNEDARVCALQSLYVANNDLEKLAALARNAAVFAHHRPEERRRAQVTRGPRAGDVGTALKPKHRFAALDAKPDHVRSPVHLRRAVAPKMRPWGPPSMHNIRLVRTCLEPARQAGKSNRRLRAVTTLPLPNPERAGWPTAGLSAIRSTKSAVSAVGNLLGRRGMPYKSGELQTDSLGPPATPRQSVTATLGPGARGEQLAWRMLNNGRSHRLTKARKKRRSYHTPCCRAGRNYNQRAQRATRRHGACSSAPPPTRAVRSPRPLEPARSRCFARRGGSCAAPTTPPSLADVAATLMSLLRRSNARSAATEQARCDLRLYDQLAPDLNPPAFARAAQKVRRNVPTGFSRSISVADCGPAPVESQAVVAFVQNVAKSVVLYLPRPSSSLAGARLPGCSMPVSTTPPIIRVRAKRCLDHATDPRVSSCSCAGLKILASLRRRPRSRAPPPIQLRVVSAFLSRFGHQLDAAGRRRQKASATPGQLRQAPPMRTRLDTRAVVGAQVIAAWSPRDQLGTALHHWGDRT